MNTRKHPFRQLILATLAAATLTVAATGTAQAEAPLAGQIPPLLATSNSPT